MAALGVIGAVVFGTAVVLAFFFFWGKGLQRYGRKADVLAVSPIVLFFALVAFVILIAPPY